MPGSLEYLRSPTGVSAKNLPKKASGCAHSLVNDHHKSGALTLFLRRWSGRWDPVAAAERMRTSVLHYPPYSVLAQHRQTRSLRNEEAEFEVVYCGSVARSDFAVWY